MEATAKAGLSRALDRATTVVAVLMSIYHLVACNINLFQAGQHINLHILFALVIVFLQAIKIKEGRPTWQGWCMIGLLAASVAVCVYIHFNYTNFMTALGAQPFDKVFSGVCILLIVLIATQRTWGWVIPVISVIALLYGYFGPYLPGPLFHGGLSFSRLITYVTTNFDGIYGMLASVSANTIILFTIFGGMMDAFGAIGAIMNVAMSASTKIRSGGAQVAVLSSGLIGSITGSVAANITLTGAVSIPLMKKRGYPAEFAAACEAAASTGGSILPPVMNAAAFIIASWTGIPYITLVFVGITPALLYYGGIALSVYIKACKLGDEKVRDETLTAFHSAFLNLLVFIIPVIVLVVLMVMGESAQKSLFLAICCLALVGLLQQFVMREEKPLQAFVKKLLAGFENGGRTVASIAVVMACMGVVVQMMTATGLSSKISQFALAIAGDNLLILAIVVALTCVLFGMGMPSASAYILAALLGAPALTTFGVPVVVAHFFVFYFAEMSALTPPVAIGCLVAAGLAKADFFKTCLISMRLAIVGFVLPFLFLYRPALLLQGTVLEWAWAVLMVVAFLFCFIVFCEDFFRTRTVLWERIIAGVGALCCVLPFYALDFAGLALFGVLIISQGRRVRRERSLKQAE